MQVFRFLGISAALLCLCLPAYADLAVPPVEPPPPIEIESVTPDDTVQRDSLPGYRGEQKPEFPGMEVPPSPPEPLPPASH